MKVYIMFTIAFLAEFASFECLKFINKHDREANFKINIVVRLIFSFVVAALSVILLQKYGISIQYFKYLLVAVYLIFCAYTDAKTTDIYTFISRLFGLIGIIFLAIELVTKSYDPKQLSWILAVFLLNFILAKMGKLGWGDVEVFTVVAIYIGGVASVIIVIAANSIGVLSYIKPILTRTFDFKKQTALVPYIAFTTILFLIIL